MRQPLGVGEEELVAHQDTLFLLEQHPRLSVAVQQLGDRQVSKITVQRFSVSTSILTLPPFTDIGGCAGGLWEVLLHLDGGRKW